jgi:hypothetical protein
MPHHRLPIRHRTWGTVFGIIATLIIVFGNLRDSKIYWRLLPFTKYIFQTLGFEQRWGMYGYDYLSATYTRYLYESQNGEVTAVYPRYWRQQQFNPFQFVKMEDFGWYFVDSPAYRELQTKVLQYQCQHPEAAYPKPAVIYFQVARASFPNMSASDSAYDPARQEPEFQTVLEVRCP